jgi:quercetin dioxygenase-like cupin family protein
MSILAQLSLTALVALSLSAAADEPKTAPHAQRTVLEYHDQSGVPGKEIAIGSAMLPAGTAIGYHTHPGDEAGYVVQGFLILKVRGQPDRTLNAGDSFFIPLGAVHSLAATPGEDGGIVVSTWIIDKGKPLASAVP